MTTFLAKLFSKDVAGVGIDEVIENIRFLEAKHQSIEALLESTEASELAIRRERILGNAVDQGALEKLTLSKAALEGDLNAVEDLIEQTRAKGITVCEHMILKAREQHEVVQAALAACEKQVAEEILSTLTKAALAMNDLFSQKLDFQAFFQEGNIRVNVAFAEFCRVLRFHEYDIVRVLGEKDACTIAKAGATKTKDRQSMLKQIRDELSACEKKANSLRILGPEGLLLRTLEEQRTGNPA